MKNLLTRILVLSLLVMAAIAAPDQQANALGFGSPVNRISVSATSSALDVYTYSDPTGTVDETAALTTFALAHNGNVILPPGAVHLSLFNPAVTTHITALIPGTVTIKHGNTTPAICFEPARVGGTCAAGGTITQGNVLGSKQLVTEVLQTSTTANAQNRDDDIMTRLTVSDASAYHSGDELLIADSTMPMASHRTTKTISSIAIDDSTGLVTVATTTSHGYPSTPSSTAGTTINLMGLSTLTELNSHAFHETFVDSTHFTLQQRDSTASNVDGRTLTGYSVAHGPYSTGGTTSNSGFWTAESAHVGQVDYINNRIFITPRLKLTTYYTDHPVVWRWTKQYGFTMGPGIKITSDADYTDQTIETRAHSMYVIGVPDAVVEGLKCENSWAGCLILESTPRAQVKNLTTRNLPDMMTTGGGTSGTVSVTNCTSAAPAVCTTASSLSTNDVIYFNPVQSGWTGLAKFYYAARTTQCTGGTAGAGACTSTEFELKDTNGYHASSSGFPAWSGTLSVTKYGSSPNGLGYGVSVRNAGEGVTVNGIDATEGRHPDFTTDTSDIKWDVDNTGYLLGATTNLKVDDVVGNGCYGFCADTHELLFGAKFRNFKFSGSIRGPEFGTYPGGGLQERGEDIEVDGLSADEGIIAIRLASTAGDCIAGCEFWYNNVNARNLVSRTNSAGSASTGIFIQDFDAYTTAFPKVHISNSNFTHTYYGVQVGKKVTADISNSKFADIQYPVSVGAGGSVRIYNPVTDWSTYSWATVSASADAQICYQLSDSPNGGSTCEITNLVNVKGSNAAYPRNIFFRADSTSADTYALNGFVEENPSAVTKTIKTAGTGTFTQATTVTSAAEGRTSVADAAYVVLPLDKYVGYSSLSATRVVTLPAANTVPAGRELVVADESGSASSSVKLTLTRAGSDTINGATTEDITTAYGWRRLISNGSNAWNYDGSMVHVSKAQTITNKSTTTQSSADNSTLIATDAFANTAATNAGTAAVTSAVATSNAYTDASIPAPGMGSIAYRSGSYQTSTAATTTATLAADTLVAFPIYISQAGTYVGMAFTPTVATTITYKTALYNDDGGTAGARGKPGTLVSGSSVTSASLTVASATTEDQTFSVAITVSTPGWYWMAIKASGSSTITAETAQWANRVIGGSDASSTAIRYSVADTFSNAVPNPFGSGTFNTTALPPRLMLKAQ